MAALYSENWSGYANGDKIKDIEGWTVVASFASYADAPQVNASNQIKALTNDGVVAYRNMGTPSHYAEVVIKYASTATPTYFGPCVRAIDRYNFISFATMTASSCAITYRSYGAGTGGTQILFTYAATPIAINDVVGLYVDNDAQTIQLYINDVAIGTPKDITGISSGDNAGLYFAGSKDPVFGAVELGTLADLPLTIDEDLDRQVHVVEDLISHSYNVSGTYTTLANPIKYRVTEFVSGAVVTDWTLLGGTAADNVWTGTIEMPIGPYYKIEYRVGDDAATVVGTNKVGFGLVVLFDGQSNTYNFMGSGTAATASDNVSFFDGSAYAKPSAGAYVHALNAISAANNNCAIAACTTAVSATSIDQHLSGGSNYANRVAMLDAIGGKASVFWWGQGESNVGNPSTYYDALDDLYTDLLTRSGQTASTLPMFIVQLGRNAGVSGDDAGWQGIRDAQTSFANATTGVFISHQSMDASMSDGLHRNSAGLLGEALRFADSVNYYIGASTNSGRGPIPTSATFTGSDVTITHNLNGSAALTVPTGAENLYELTNDNFSTVVPPTSVAYEAPNKIVLTFASIPAEPLKIRSHQGQDFTVAEFPTGDLTYNSQAVMVEPITLELGVTEGVSTTSTAPLIIEGITDGDYEVKLWSESTNLLLFNATTTFTGNESTVDVTAPIGTVFTGRWLGTDPPTTGTGVYGVTE